MGDHSGMPPMGDHSGMPPMGDHSGMPPMGDHSGTGSDSCAPGSPKYLAGTC
jgi:hypothetical protein